MSGPGDDPSGDAAPTPVLPDDPSIDGGERAAAEAAEGASNLAEAEAALGPAPESSWMASPETTTARAADRNLDEPTSRGGLLRSSAIVGVGTGLSRLTGLLRVLALFYALQFTSLTDAYNAANTAPNTIYELLLGGVLSATLVPVFVEARHREDDAAVDAVVTMISVVLVAVTVLAILLAPWIFRIYTDDTELISVGVPFLRMFAPQVLFYGLTAVATALLNSRKRFAAPAFAPVLNNLVLIAILLQVRHLAGGVPTIGEVTDDTTLLLLLGFGTTAGIVAMTVVLWPAMRRAGIRLHASFDWHNPAIRTVARLSGWTFGYVIANQVALVVVQRLAIDSGVGNLSAYTFAFIFFQLPHGLLAVSLMTTYLPDLSALANRHDLAGFRSRFMEGTRLLVLLVVPAAVGLAVLARPLMDGLLGVLGQTRSSATDAVTTADILRMFAIGLPGFSVYLFTLRGFYALKDTRTPFLVNVAENGTNILFAWALVGGLSVTGLGLAYSIAYLVGAALALVLLTRKVGRLWSPEAAASIGRTLVAAAAMGLVVWGLVVAAGSVSSWSAVALSFVAAVVGLGVYFGVLVAMRSDDVGGLTRRLQARRSGAGSPTAP